VEAKRGKAITPVETTVGGGSREGGQGRAAASTWPLALELENDDLAMDRRVGVVGRVLHVLATSQGLKGAE
jgi:hypothetical protein